MLRAGKDCMRCLDKQLMSRGDKQTLAKCSTARFSVKADLKAINETCTRNVDSDYRSRVWYARECHEDIIPNATEHM